MFSGLVSRPNQSFSFSDINPNTIYEKGTGFTRIFKSFKDREKLEILRYRTKNKCISLIFSL